jgi:hypothetical protein
MKMNNVTTEEILDWVVASDSFLILLSRIMSSLENSFDFDHHKIKNNFVTQFEKNNNSSGIASRSKSRFTEISDKNKMEVDEESVGKQYYYFNC